MQAYIGNNLCVCGEVELRVERNLKGDHLAGCRQVRHSPTVRLVDYIVLGIGDRRNASATLFGKNMLRNMMGDQVKLPDPVWRRLNYAWITFFVGMGFLNRYVAVNYPTDTWVNFKLFGGMGLMVVFMLAQGFYLSRHIEAEATDPPPPAA